MSEVQTGEPVGPGLMRGEDGQVRCWWHGGKPDYLAYHDREWGRPVDNDIRLFEKICLEGFQSGLSWLTILRKRENFRAAFAGFEPARIAAFDETDIERMVADKGIVRHRGKIVSTINNSRRALEMIDEFGSLSRFFWSYEPGAGDRPEHVDHETLMKLAKTETSTRLSKDLKKRGWSFVGPTTVYAFMQAMGMVNDHLEGCYIRPEAEAERLEFVRPG